MFIYLSIILLLYFIPYQYTLDTCDYIAVDWDAALLAVYTLWNGRRYHRNIITHTWQCARDVQDNMHENVNGNVQVIPLPNRAISGNNRPYEFI